MQPEYLSRLSASLQELVHEIENEARLSINLESDSSLNRTGHLSKGALAISIDSRRVKLFVPTDGYFPDGAVRHELLHAYRFLVQGVPQLVLSKTGRWSEGEADRFTALDNAIEHLIIVPLELQLHPERLEHWEVGMNGMWAELPNQPRDEQRLSACLHWTLLKHVLPDSPANNVARELMTRLGWWKDADKFAVEVLKAIQSKEEMLRVLFRLFPELDISRAELKYLMGLNVAQ